LRFELFIIPGHEATELEYQELHVNRSLVVEGQETKTKVFFRLTHEQCREKTLPVAYQRIADRFLGSKTAAQAKQLLIESRDLQLKVYGSFQQCLLPYSSS